MFKCGWHFVGDWHTHPEPRPTPSRMDISSVQETFIKSRHSLKSLVLVIVGADEPPEGLYVALVTATALHALRVGTERDPADGCVGDRVEVRRSCAS